MTKIGIMTFHGAHNYGSVLQAYATQSVISELGYSSEIINYRLENQREFYNKLYSTRFGFKDFVRRMLRMTEHKQRVARLNKFEEFINGRLCITNAVYGNYENLCNEKFPYSVLISGSDQVWNEHCTAEFKTEPQESILGYYLAFGQSNVYRLSFSSSFGSMKKDEIRVYLPHLDKYRFLSVREDDGAEMLSTSLNREVTNTLDPTLLLNREQWNIDGVYDCRRSYIFVYTLKRYKPVQRLLKNVKVLARKLELDVICVAPFSPVHILGIEGRPDCGPLDFISYIRSASLVITDSFHGTAFSINMGIPFFTLQLGKDHRKELLLEKLGLSDRILHSMDEIMSIKEYSCSFSESELRLEAEREKSKNYLKRALQEAGLNSNTRSV